MELTKNSYHTVKITGYTSEGAGVAKIDNKVIFIPGTISGEVCSIKIVKVGKNVNYGILDSVIEASDNRQIPKCPHYRKCGGCSLMHMSYDEELRFKKEKVEDDLKRIGHVDIELEEIVGMSTPYRYRNKAIFNIKDENGTPLCGFYRNHSHDVTNVTDCLISSEDFSIISSIVTQWMTDNNIKAYDGQDGIRHIFIRQGYFSKEIQVCLVSTTNNIPALDILIQQITAYSDKIKSIVLNINNYTGNTVLKGKFITIWGKNEISDTMCGLKFALAPQSFYQVNTQQAELLYQKVIQYAQIDSHTKVLDLYCGIGTISLAVAKKAEYVIGVEIVPEAVENAYNNAINNGINNARFINADAEQAVEYIQNQSYFPNVVIVDPPRKGLTSHTINTICQMDPNRIVYVSCDPATLARDISIFRNNNYFLLKASAVDMFARTFHVETVSLLSRAEGTTREA